MQSISKIFFCYSIYFGKLKFSIIDFENKLIFSVFSVFSIIFDFNNSVITFLIVSILSNCVAIFPLQYKILL